MIDELFVSLWSSLLASFRTEDRRDSLTEDAGTDFAETEATQDNNTEIPVIPADERTPLLV